MLINTISACNARKLHQRDHHRWCRHWFSPFTHISQVIGFGVNMKNCWRHFFTQHSTT